MNNMFALFDTDSFDIQYSMVTTLITIVSIFIVVIVVFTLTNYIKTNVKNNNSPKIDASARVVTKRSEVHTYRNNSDINNITNTRSNTQYFVTFEFKSGDRMEFNVSSTEYGLLAEHDEGTIQFQGTRFLNFTRNGM